MPTAQTLEKFIARVESNAHAGAIAENVHVAAIWDTGDVAGKSLEHPVCAFRGDRSGRWSERANQEQAVPAFLYRIQWSGKACVCEQKVGR